MGRHANTQLSALFPTEGLGIAAAGMVGAVHEPPEEGAASVQAPRRAPAQAKREGCVSSLSLSLSLPTTDLPSTRSWLAQLLSAVCDWLAQYPRPVSPVSKRHLRLVSPVPAAG